LGQKNSTAKVALSLIRPKRKAKKWKGVLGVEFIRFLHKIAQLKNSKSPMKSIPVLCAIICFNFSMRAQELPEILKTLEYKRGIYKNYEEFLKNEPTITGEFDIITKDDNKAIQEGKETYLLAMADSSHTREYLKHVWGFSNGKKIFVNEINYGEKYGFKALKAISRYCYYLGTDTKKLGLGVNVQSMPIGPIASIPMAITKPYILNINNGKFFLLNRDIVRAILSKDKDLLNAYESEGGKGSDEVMFKYIDLYNKKYFNEASGAMINPIQVVILRKDKKERNEMVNIMLSDSSKVEMKLNSVYKHGSFEKAIKICLNGNCNDVILTKNVINYFQCSWSQNDNAPTLLKMDPKAGEYYAARFDEMHLAE
jgi:hypothetical protein